MFTLPYPKKTVDARTQFLLSYTSVWLLSFSIIYCLTILYDYVRAGAEYTGFSPLLGITVVCIFFSSYIANKKRYSYLSLVILTTTIITLCTLAGIWWGFDLPSTLLGYVLSITIMGMIGNRSQNKIHMTVIFAVMMLGQAYRDYLSTGITWYGTPSGLTDIFEIVVMLGVITSLLVFSHRAEQNLLDRAKRTEGLLRSEKENLEVRIEQKVSELKKMQTEHLSTIYRFVEFGKISSGLFHDLMSPVQTLKIYLETLAQETSDLTPNIQITRIQSVAKKIEAMLETMRKQIRFNQEVETFDLIQDIRDILLITRHLYLKHNISIDIESTSPVYTIESKRIMINHVLLNLISNACEACDPKNQENSVTIHVGMLLKGPYKTYISIADTGSGISEEKLQHIFDSFYSTKKKNLSMNCGIGLSSSKHVIENYLNGKILVESEEGLGTTMTILLPDPYISSIPSITTGSTGLSF